MKYEKHEEKKEKLQTASAEALDEGVTEASEARSKAISAEFPEAGAGEVANAEAFKGASGGDEAAFGSGKAASGSDETAFEKRGRAKSMPKRKIALAGNPNSGKTTLFNLLTGSNQFVGNWPGVTVEKKEGRLKNHKDVLITDLPGIYSLSPYTLEEVVARNYLIGERPDAVLNIVDATNLERNLYLTTQLLELGIPTVVALNMMDVVKKNGDRINSEELSRQLGCPVLEISALKERGIDEAAAAAVAAAKQTAFVPRHTFEGSVEHALAHIEEACVHHLPEERQRWYAVKLFERDSAAVAELKLPASVMSHIELDIEKAEAELDDDAESIITNERYVYIAKILKGAYKKNAARTMTSSDKIDRVVTNKWLALPIFALVMTLVYYVSITTVGGWVTDWTNDGLFGDGWHMLGVGGEAFDEAKTDFAKEHIWTKEVLEEIAAAKKAGITGAEQLESAAAEEDFGAFEEAYGFYGAALTEAGWDISETVDAALESEDFPRGEDFGAWVPGIPVLLEKVLDAAKAGDWLKSLVLDGIVAGVGAVLGFVPQMLVLFAFLAFLEACGYMARIAFVMDRIFRRFGLSGKSFIPMLIATGCSIPGIMASRTIESERDRRLTIMTTSFMPCGAKVPIIALLAASLFNNAGWVMPSAYFIGMAAIVVSGIMLKKTGAFAGEAAPFVMELPAYRMPTAKNILRSMWERGSSFIRKAGTIILLATIFIWFMSVHGFADGKLVYDSEMELSQSVIGKIGGAIAVIFEPLGFGNITAAVATFMGLVAKEEVVSVFGVLDFGGMTRLAAYSFLIFNLLCAPCFAAIGAIRREMNSAKWTWLAIAYQCIFAYAVSLVVYQVGGMFTGTASTGGLAAAMVVLAIIVYMLTRPERSGEEALSEKEAGEKE